MTDEVRKDLTVSILAQWVVESNKINAQMSEEDSGEKVDISEYGTDLETIGIILKDLYPEVQKEVQEIQSESQREKDARY